MESILNSIKKMLGIEPEDTSFDDEIIMHINSAFMVLYQLGVGTADPFSIEDSKNTWDEFLVGKMNLNAVKSDIYLRVKLLFDSSTMTSALISEAHKEIDELEWYLSHGADH